MPETTQLHNLTVAQAAAMIRDGRISCEELASALLARSRALEPRLRVWAALDEDAVLASARSRDRELAAEGVRGPLHGVPVGVKDIYDARGYRTAAGSSILADCAPAADDSVAVSRLRRAGAVVMGKTVTTEFACGDPPPTRNPWNAAHTPGGSSSGSAVGVAACVFPAALGSQTAGSVLRPAAFNGAVGLKPTFGRISRRGVVPVAESLDTMGHFARTVEDAAILLQIMAGQDRLDPASAARPVESCAPVEDVADLRIGIAGGFFERNAAPEAWSAMTRFADLMAASRIHLEYGHATGVPGARVESADISADFDAMLRAHRVLMTTEAADVHRDWFAARADEYSPNVRQVIEDGLGASAVDYLGAKRVQREFAAAVDAALEGFDVLLTPAAPSAAPRDLSGTGDPMFQTPFTFGGFPAISLPATLDANGMPLAIQLAAKRWDDRLLLQTAALAERALGFSEAPPA